MDIRGIWKVKEVRVPTPDGVKVFTPDNPPQEERFEGSAELMNYRTEFAEDGMLNTLMFVPEEMRQEAANQGGGGPGRTATPPSKAPPGRRQTASSITIPGFRARRWGSRWIPSWRSPSQRTGACCMGWE